MLLLDPTKGCLEEDVGTKTLGLHDRVVVQGSDVKIAGGFYPVRWKVSTASRIRLPDPSGTMDKDLAESAVVRLVGVLVTQVPLAEDAGRISTLLE